MSGYGSRGTIETFFLREQYDRKMGAGIESLDLHVDTCRFHSLELERGGFTVWSHGCLAREPIA